MPSIVAYSELMYDQSCGTQAGAFSGKMETLAGPLDEPTLLGLRGDGRLSVIVPSREGGPVEWQSPIDIGPQWTDGSSKASIKDFAVHQDADTLETSIALLVSVSAPGGATSNDLLFVAEGLAPCDGNAWANIGSIGTIVRQFSSAASGEIRSTSCLTMLQMPDAGTHTQSRCGIVVAGTRADGSCAIALITPDVLQGNWIYREKEPPGKNPPASLKGWRALTRGWFPGPGFFCLADNGLRYAQLTPNGEDYLSEGIIDIGDATSLLSIAAAPPADTKSGVCTLYGGSSGIYKWNAAAITGAKPPEQLLASGTMATKVPTRIAVCADNVTATADSAAQTAAIVSFLSPLGELYYARDVLSNPVASEVPVLVATDVGATAGVKLIPNARDDSTYRYVMVVSYADGHVSVMERDSAASAANDSWETELVLVPAVTRANGANAGVIEQQTYTTRIVVTDDNGQPVPFARVTLSASTTCIGHINDSCTRMPFNVPIPAMAGSDGAINLVLPCTALETPQFSVTRVLQDAMLSDGAPTVVDPSESTLQKLRALTSADDLARAKDCHGNAVFKQRPQEAQQVVEFLKEMFQRRDLTRQGLTSSEHIAALSRPICLRRTAAGVELLHDEEARKALGDLDLGHLISTATLGLFLLASRRQLQSLEATIGVTNAPNGLTYLVVHIGKEIYSALLWQHFVPSVLNMALDCVLQGFLALSPEQIVEWLGWVFDWTRVGKLHGATTRLADLTLQYAYDNISKMANAFDNALNTLDDGLNYAQNKKLAGSINSNSFLRQKIGDFALGSNNIPYAPQASHSPPTYSILNKMLSGAHEGMFSFDKVKQLDFSVFDVVTTALTAPLTQLADSVSAALGGADISQMTFAEILRYAAQIGLSAIRSALKSAVAKLIENIKTLHDNVQNYLAAETQIPTLNYLWTVKLGKTTTFRAMDLFCLGAACCTTFVCDSARVPGFSDWQIATITDSKYTTLPEVLAALNKPPKLPWKRANRGDKIQAFTYFGATGTVQIISAFFYLVSAGLTTFQMYLTPPNDNGIIEGGIGMYLPNTVHLLADPALLINPAGGFPGPHKWGFHVLHLIRSIVNVLAVLFCWAFFFMTWAWSPYNGSLWWNLYAVLYFFESIYFTVKDWIGVYCNRNNKDMPKLYGKPVIEFGMGVTFLCVVTVAVTLMALEERVPVEFWDGWWQADTAVAGIVNGLVQINIMSGWLEPAPWVKASQVAMMFGLNTTFMAKGVLEIFMSEIAAYTDFCALSSAGSNVPGGSINVFAADASGPSAGVSSPLTGASSPLSSTTGIVSIGVTGVGQVTEPLVNAFVVPLPASLYVYTRGPYGGFRQTTLSSRGQSPARAKVGPEGLYVVDTTSNATTSPGVYLYDLPLNLDHDSAQGQMLITGLAAPTAAVAYSIQGKDNGPPVVVIYVADNEASGAVIKLFQQIENSYGQVGTIAVPGVTSINDLALDANNNIIILSGTSSILVIPSTASGTVSPITTWAFSKSEITDVTTDTQGNVLYTDTSSINVLPLSTPSGTDPTPSANITSSDAPLNPIAVAARLSPPQ